MARYAQNSLILAALALCPALAQSDIGPPVLVGFDIRPMLCSFTPTDDASGAESTSTWSELRSVMKILGGAALAIASWFLWLMSTGEKLARIPNKRRPSENPADESDRDAT